MTTQKTTEKLQRPSVPAMDAILGHAHQVLDHGFVRVVDYMGDEGAIVQAARVSYGAGTETPSSDRSLLRYLMRQRHTTPFEMCEIKLHVKLPIFVARQWIRHRTANVNEYSARYSIMEREFYVPKGEDLAPQSTTNKQGRAGGYDAVQAGVLQEIIREASNDAFDAYEDMIKESNLVPALSRELARINLPLNTYTEWYWKVDLHNLMHFLKLRADPHAQMEIRVYAEEIMRVMKVWVPTVFEAFEDYVLEACTFSKAEMKLLRDLIKPQTTFFYEGMTEREITAFGQKMGFLEK